MSLVGPVGRAAKKAMLASLSKYTEVQMRDPETQVKAFHEAMAVGRVVLGLSGPEQKA